MRLFRRRARSPSPGPGKRLLRQDSDDVMRAMRARNGSPSPNRGSPLRRSPSLDRGSPLRRSPRRGSPAPARDLRAEAFLLKHWGLHGDRRNAPVIKRYLRSTDRRGVPLHTNETRRNPTSSSWYNAVRLSMAMQSPRGVDAIVARAAVLAASRVGKQEMGRLRHFDPAQHRACMAARGGPAAKRACLKDAVRSAWDMMRSVAAVAGTRTPEDLLRAYLVNYGVPNALQQAATKVKRVDQVASKAQSVVTGAMGAVGSAACALAPLPGPARTVVSVAAWFVSRHAGNLAYIQAERRYVAWVDELVKAAAGKRVNSALGGVGKGAGAIAPVQALVAKFNGMRIPGCFRTHVVSWMLREFFDAYVTTLAGVRLDWAEAVKVVMRHSGALGVWMEGREVSLREFAVDLVNVVPLNQIQALSDTLSSKMSSFVNLQKRK